MDPVRRAALPAHEVTVLTDAMAASMHEVFIIAVVLAGIATLFIAVLPKGLRDRKSTTLNSRHRFI